MEKLALFQNKKEKIFFVLFMLAIFIVCIYFHYSAYEKFHQHKFYHTKAKVLNHYQKVKKNSGKIYQVLKLKSKDGAVFYTTNYEDIIDLNDRNIWLGVITDKIDFWDYLHTFYVPSYDIRIEEKANSFKDALANFISSQHENNLTKELFLALFLAKPISKELRGDVSRLGISHLIAISGFHLGVLFGIFYFLLKYPYGYLQDRYFPYRNMRFDLTFLILIILFSYLYMLDFIPSLLRSFVMLFYGFFLFHRHLKIISFEVLFVTVLTILAIFPSFVFSIGFWFSVAGVFYIYLFLEYFSHLKNWQIVLLLNIWVFVLMIPVVHYFFDIFSLHQLYSPLLSIAFGIFYPLEMFLHLVGQGDLLDEWIVKLLDQDIRVYHIQTPFWYMVLYIGISIGSIYQKRLLWILLPMSLAIFFI